MATINGVQTIQDIWAVSLSGDPSTAGGTASPIGTFGGASDGSGIWYKSTSLDTGWVAVATLTSGVVTPSQGGTGIANNSASTITISGNFATTFVTTSSSSYTLPTATSTLLANNLGLSGGSTFVGGTGTTDSSVYKGTSGNATAILVAHSFVGGNNGATTIASLYNDGQFLINTTTRIGGTPLAIFRVGASTSSVDLGSSTGGHSTLWMGLAQATSPTSTNWTLDNDNTNTIVRGVGRVQLQTGSSTILNIQGTGNQILWTPVASSGTSTSWSYTEASHTTITASTEKISVLWDMSSTVQHGTGLLGSQTAISILAPTYSFVGTSTLTDGSTLRLSGASKGGTNATQTNGHAILILAGAVTNTTNAYGITCNSPTGATSNFSAQFIGGLGVKLNHLIGNTSAPTTTAGAGAGTTPTISLSNATDLSGIVNVTTGTLPTGTNAVIVTITFNTAYGVAPNISLTPANAITALLSGVTSVFVTSTTTTFVITSGTTALTASTAYSWFYTIIQ